MKIPAKYIASHLPYRTKFYNENNGNVFTLTNPWRSTLNHFDDGGGPFIDLGEYTPILRPMEDLNTEIKLENGATFVPLEELKKMVAQQPYAKSPIESVTLQNNTFIAETSLGVFEVDIDPGAIAFHFVREDRQYSVGEEMAMLWILFEWQFDVWGIIGTYAYNWNKIFGDEKEKAEFSLDQQNYFNLSPDGKFRKLRDLWSQLKFLEDGEYKAEKARMEQRGHYTSEEIAVIKTLRYIELGKGNVNEIKTE